MIPETVTSLTPVISIDVHRHICSTNIRCSA